MDANIQNVLIIDDSSEDQKLYERYTKRLTDRKLNIYQAKNAKESLDLLEKTIPDCILLDYRLPDMNGIEWLKNFKTHMLKHTPVIMLTGQGDEQVAVDALKHGVHDYLVKDKVTAASLQHAITQAINKSELELKVKEQQETIELMAYSDYLTGAANRMQFEKMAAMAISRAKRYKRFMGILIIDLDHFKRVNNTFGHQVGDELLKETVKRLQKGIRENDTLARIGGDEFAIVLDEMDQPKDAAIVANR